MAATGPYFYLRADERALLRLRAAPRYALALMAPALAALALVALLLVAARTVAPPLQAIPPWAPWAVAAAAGALVALVSWRRAATSEYALTDERIYARVGRLVTKLHFTTHDKVTDIRYRQGPLERALGVASLTFATAGGDVRVAGIPDAIGLKEAAERARDAFLRRLLADAGAPAPAPVEAPSAPQPVAPTAPEWSGPRPGYLQGGDTPVWYARPRPIAALGAARSLLGIIPILLFSSYVRGRGAWIALAALGLVLLLVAVRLMQLRRMEYVATDRRVYARAGLLGTTVNQLTYDKITDITYNQDLLGRLLGYGSVTVHTAGGGSAPIVLLGLADALAAKETIERWRDASLGRRA